MDKRIILAVAGAGKTYTLCNCLNSNERNMILAFTNRNIYNIQRELIKQYGTIPNYTKVMTFHSFIYQFGIQPFLPSIFKFFKNKPLKIEGISLKEPPPQFKNDRPNPYYIKKDQLGHYIDKNNKFFCCRLSELILYLNEKSKKDEKFIHKITSRFMMFFDNILIDEFQYFRINDYNFLMLFLKQINNVTLVGDYYQHSVSGQNNHGKPFTNKINSYEKYIQLLQDNKFYTDTTTLVNSRRCSSNICDFVNSKLNIPIESAKINTGSISKVLAENIDNILSNNSIKKLILQNPPNGNYSFNYISWGNSKGDTYDNTCVILTDETDDILEDTFEVKNISQVIRNKLYVALTRSKGDVYIIQKKLFDSVKNNYIIKQ